MKDRQHALIERFFTGELTDDEDREFRQQMTDQAFGNAVDLQRRLRRQLTDERRQSPLGELFDSEARQLGVAGKSSGRVRRLIVWSAAAAVLLLLVGSSWWANANYGDETLADRFHQPIYDDTQAGIPNAQDLLREAKRAFFRGEYARSGELLNAIPATEPNFYQQAQALQAYVLFNQKNYEATIQQIDRTLATEGLNFAFPEGGTDKLRWTRMLAHLGAGKADSPAFRNDLDFFLGGLNESYRSRAQELRASLNSGWRRLVF